MSTKFKIFAAFGLTGTVGASFASYLLLTEDRSGPWSAVCAEMRSARSKFILPSRNDQIKSLMSEKFDVLIIGGGAVGARCALDATTRGLKTALVDRDDFSSGSPSKTSKMIHGGVKNLELAITNRDPEMYIAKEATRERHVLLKQAPHLAYVTPFVLPAYQWWEVPYYYVGLKMYSLLSGLHEMKSCYYVSKNNLLQIFPMLRRNDLCGGIVYYNGTMNDARLNLSTVLTAAKFGATVANHVAVTGLKKAKKDEKEVITGVHVKDELSGKTWDISAKCVINATGPFIDGIRKLDNPDVKKMCSPTIGTHITLPVRRGDILSAWTEVRSLVADSCKLDPESISPNHVVHLSDSNLITAAGGKWITYRLTAEDAVDVAIKACNLIPNFMVSQTKHLRLVGAKDWTPNSYIRLVQDFGMDVEIAQHLSKTYGYEAFAVAEMASITGKHWPVLGKRLHPEFPYIDAEVRYGVRREYAMTAVDMIARRLRLAYLNVHAAQEVVEEIVDIMAEELKWSRAEKQRQIKEAQEFLENDMGQNAIRATRREKSKRKIPVNLSSDEVLLYTNRFYNIDKDRRGYISMNDVRQSFERNGEKEITCEEFHEILKEIDTSVNGQAALDEYLQIMNAIKIGYIDYSNYARKSKQNVTQEQGRLFKKNIPMEHSFGV